MISYNPKQKFPQLVVRETKYNNFNYLANSPEELLDIAHYIVNDWIENGELEHLSEEMNPAVDLLNSEKASLTPWQYAPYTKLDQIKFVMDNIESYSEGKTPALLEETFSKRTSLREKWDNLLYWKLKIIQIINDNDGSEYMKVNNENFSSFK